ncbi:GNAT family N-acetyltransferase [Rhodobium gokarnense]|uniref:L-ornithine N(alpha)-acyltransferase n=1 Tax=Rhodobium gokarnense TaxID=364296 RepID=A0ABT3HI80_9HYPH|nr:GNAT family N-acyltransferase [Rhodobium gokarnense]MCW2310116.1 putative hemolysin [Rhodobium gokarnense]
MKYRNRRQKRGQMKGSDKQPQRGGARRFTPIGKRPVTGNRWIPGLRSPTGRILPAARAAAAPTLGQIGSLEVRLARSWREIKIAQQLRYHVFYEEMSAVADAQTLATRRDSDSFDNFCDHLLVLDHDIKVKTNALGRKKPQIVGTYRLLRQEVAEMHGGFYTADEFDMQPLLDRKPDLNFMELGRSCVLKPYRNKRTMELLWHGIWAYVLMNKIDAMIGCASLEGTDPNRLALPLSFLHHNFLAPEEWRVRALGERYTEMNRIPKDELDGRAALHALPPLIKGYLRLGAMIGDGAVIDHQFGTVDALIIMPVSELNPRYVNYYGADASRHKA